MLRELLRVSALKISLVEGELLCSLDKDRGKMFIPKFRPGLYIGNYHPELYGQFSHEVILLRFQQFDFNSPESVTAFKTEICRGKSTEFVVQDFLDATFESTSSRVGVFLVGRKVCGDVHVPMGTVSFFVLVNVKTRSKLPSLAKIQTYYTEDEVEVLDGWDGFGTLSQVGFCDPTYSSCKLLQLTHKSSDCNKRIFYAVCWTYGSWVPLKWLEEQETNPFFGF
eukprot:TRINITY_DN15973_c0_g1_i2.p1 TRINITY_DN15973_c0_g1~~TRINITY_DN15973_c0_g1_i2.p1  ORF type:complete len:224 (-),score=37.79 TRINITY_DN15973_c0_g1_i2:46-717(-)